MRRPAVLAAIRAWWHLSAARRAFLASDTAIDEYNAAVDRYNAGIEEEAADDGE